MQARAPRPGVAQAFRPANGRRATLVSRQTVSKLAACFLCAATLSAIKPDALHSSRSVPAHVAGRFREVAGFQQSASGQYFVFDRRGHTVYGLDEQQSSSWEIVQIGAEPGRIIDPTAFAVAPNGTFVVADAPNGRERIQIFTARTAGRRLRDARRCQESCAARQQRAERHRVAAVHRHIHPAVAA